MPWSVAQRCSLETTCAVLARFFLAARAPTLPAYLSAIDTPVELARSSMSTLVSASAATSSTASERAAAAAGLLSPEMHCDHPAQHS